MKYTMTTVLFLTSLFCNSGIEMLLANSDPKAIALLKGLEQQLNKYDSFSLAYTIHYEADDIMSPRQEYDHFFETKYRKNSNKADIFIYNKRSIDNKEEYLLRLCEKVYLHSSDDRGCVHLRDMSKMSSYPVYEPHVLPMMDLGFGSLTLKDMVLYHRLGHGDWTVHQDKHNDIKIWVVRCTELIRNGEAIHEMWIEEPSFRVHKSTYSFEQIKIRVENIYDDNNSNPFPKETKVFRAEADKVVCNRTIRYTDFKMINRFSEDTFTLKSLNLPLNATVHDYRISRRLGYWDGEKLVEQPVSVLTQDMRELLQEKPKLTVGRIIGFAVGIVLILLAVYLMMRNKKQRK